MPMLRAFAIKLSRNHDRAGDLVQATMLRALEARDKFEMGTNLDAWLVTLLRNLFFSERKKRAREIEDADGEISKRVPVEDSPLRKIEARETLSLVSKLPIGFRAPLLLAADGATLEEIGAEICEQVGTVKSRINRARALLKAAGGPT